MKLRKYERLNLLIFTIIFLLILEVVFFVIIFFRKTPIYNKFSSVVVKDDIVSIIVSQDELKLFYDNKYIYVGDYRKVFKRVSITRNILKRNKKSYHEVLIKFSFDKKYKVNDIIEISVVRGKISSISIFKIIWKEDSDE